jgi:hypothetical protein
VTVNTVEDRQISAGRCKLARAEFTQPAREARVSGTMWLKGRGGPGGGGAPRRANCDAANQASKQYGISILFRFRIHRISDQPKRTQYVRVRTDVDVPVYRYMYMYYGTCTVVHY